MRNLNTSVIWLEGVFKDKPFTLNYEDLVELALTPVG